MVALYGMSDKFGMMALASRRNQYLDGGYGIDCAQDTAADIDKDVMSILHSAYEKAVNIIQENREDMDKVVDYLLKKETITGEEMMAILEGRDPATADNYGARPEPQDRSIEPPARNIHMTSEPVLPPQPPQDTTPEDEAPAPSSEDDSPAGES